MYYTHHKVSLAHDNRNSAIWGKSTKHNVECETTMGGGEEFQIFPQTWNDEFMVQK